jgi:hypothetical protein
MATPHTDIRTYTFTEASGNPGGFALKSSIQTLERRDGLGVSEVESLEIETNAPSKILLMKVPMNF